MRTITLPKRLNCLFYKRNRREMYAFIYARFGSDTKKAKRESMQSGGVASDSPCISQLGDQTPDLARNLQALLASSRAFRPIPESTLPTSMVRPASRNVIQVT